MIIDTSKLGSSGETKDNFSQ